MSEWTSDAASLLRNNQNEPQPKSPPKEEKMVYSPERTILKDSHTKLSTLPEIGETSSDSPTTTRHKAPRRTYNRRVSSLDI